MRVSSAKTEPPVVRGMKRAIASAAAIGLAVGIPLAGASQDLPSIAIGDARIAPPPEAELAPVVLLVDLGTGQTLYEKNAERRFMPASVTKVITAYTAFEMIERGEIDLRQRYTFDEESYRNWRRRGSTMFLGLGEQVTVAQLLEGIMTVSANDGSALLAKGATGSVENWTARMNGEARAIGMRDSKFGSPNGFPDEGRTYTTARDLATLAQALVTRHPEKYSAFFGRQSLTWNEITQDNHDPMIGNVAGADGMKTGFTNEAGYTYLGSAARNGRRLAIVVAGAERGRDRDAAARAMIEWGFSAWQPRRLYGKGQQVGQAKVQQGASPSVGLIAPREFHLNVPTASEGELELRIAYRGPLVAPIAAGDTVARLQIRMDGELVQSAPLVAAEGVGEADALERLGNGMFGWLR